MNQTLKVSSVNSCFAKRESLAFCDEGQSRKPLGFRMMICAAGVPQGDHIVAGVTVRYGEDGREREAG